MLKHILTGLILSCLMAPLFADEPAPSPQPDQKQTDPLSAEAASDAPLDERELKFIKQLSGTVLAGNFTVAIKHEAPPKPERYEISNLKKVKDHRWIIESRITYGSLDVPVPVPVDVYWAGDTPMIQVTDLKIPLVGEGFTARVLFYGDRYAGTWQHGNIGGHMWGTIENAMSAEPAETDKAATPESNASGSQSPQQ